MHIPLKTLILISAFYCLTSGSCVTKPETEIINIHIRGTVTLNQDGSPIDSAQVTMHEDMDGLIMEHHLWETALTDSFGYYSIQGTCPILSDRYYLNVFAEKAGYAPTARSGELREGIQNINLQLFIPPH
ncbi:MAG: carboxypeptidase regulatory-like domain-containing protein [Desulfobacteraceae bacterium]|nr:carboxypeptidase regulatory-like domain-containing protein [Desulfobacteraceae bacterium]